jgi:thiol-disulfide isomerase/thioredoxin
LRAAARSAAARPAPWRGRSSQRRAAALLGLTLLGLGCGRSAEPQQLPLVDIQALQARVAAERGHPLLVAFWATWCQPCVEELPDLVALHRAAPAGLRVLAVSLDSFLSGDATPSVVAKYLELHPAPVGHVIYKGSQDALFAAFDLPGNIPYSILYAADGTVLRRDAGRTQPADIRAALQPAGASR